MAEKRLGKYIQEYSVKNKKDLGYPVYSVTNSKGFCTEYFNKDVSGEDKTTYKIVPRGYFAYNPSRINVGSIDWQNCEDNVIVSPLYVVFKCSDGLNQDYLKYYLKSDSGKKVINASISVSVRNSLKFDVLSDFKLNIGTIDEQLVVVDKLRKIEAAIENERKRIKLYDELIKSRFVEMFGDPQKNVFGYDIEPLGKTCKIITGNTPPKKVPEYYGDYIEWIKTDNIVSGKQNPTKAVEFLSDKGMNVGRTVEKDSILMACIAGSVASIGRVCITNRKVAFNQQINAIVPKQYNVVFLYVLLQLSKDYLISEINVCLKGILSKTELSLKKFIVPPSNLQNKFANYVSLIEKSKDETYKRINFFKELLAKKTDELFNGENA